MNPENQPEYGVNKKIAASLLILAGLLFGGYLFFKSGADTTSTANIASTTSATATPTPQVSSSPESAASPTATSESQAKGTVIRVDDSKFGQMLFDAKGQAIYIWEVEDSATPECYGSCASAWPPVLTDGAPVASSGVNAELLGTTQRTDGTTQVTYNGHPLYYYANEDVGEVKCHNVRTHGGLWWVIQPNGNRAS